MSIGMQTPQNIFSTFMPFGPPVLSTHGFPKKVLLASAQPLAQEFLSVQLTRHLVSLPLAQIEIHGFSMRIYATTVFDKLSSLILRKTF